MGTFLLNLPNGIQDLDGNWTKEVEIDEMEGGEEDILIDQTRSEGGTGTFKKSGSQRITEILSRCTVRVGKNRREKDRYVAPDMFKDVWDRAFSSDRAFAMIRLRQLSLGEFYVFEKNCPSCKKEIKGITIDLSKLEVKNMPIEVIQLDNHEISLPKSQDIVYWRFARGSDEADLERLMREHKEDFVSALLYMRIVGVRKFDSTSSSHLSLAKPEGGLNYLKRMKSSDRRSMQAQFEINEGGIDTDIQIVCDQCRTEFTTKLNVMGPDFFFPSATSSVVNTTSARLPSVGDGAQNKLPASPSVSEVAS